MCGGRLTAYVQGEEFRGELDRQTSKGLHLSGRYQPLRREGALGAASVGFAGSEGEKAIRSIAAKDITARFNPFGVLLRRWQLDTVRMRSGEVEIQTYEPRPENRTAKPWYAIFLPDRVYLKEVICETANVTWQFRDRPAGIFATRLLLTPHGRDFEYRANGGTMKMTPLPDLPLRQIHLLITKEWLTLYTMELAPSERGIIRIEGSAGLKANKEVKARMTFEQIPLGPWIPAAWGEQVRGTVSGWMTWQGKDQKLESSSGEGALRMQGARLLSVPFLDHVAAATRNEELEHLELEECSLKFSWRYPRGEITDLAIEARGAFRITGSLEIDRQKLNGTLEFGTTAENLEWLPKARDTLFTRQEGGYFWTKVRISGTLQDPQNDLTPRLAAVLRKSPGAATGLLFRQFGEWLEQTFTGD